MLTPEQQHAFNELTSIQTATDTIHRLELLAKQLGFDQPLASGTAEERRLLLTRQVEYTHDCEL